MFYFAKMYYLCSMFKQIIVILAVTLSYSSAVFSQEQTGEKDVASILNYMKRAMQFNIAAPQEKVYLHFDNTGYFKGETMRFKAYLTRMDTEKKSNISSVLYVELVNPIGDVIEKRTLKVENGEATGDILLDSITGASGFYEVRAFTRYMTNWGTNAIFSRVFPIFNKPKTEGDYSQMTIDKVSFRHRLPNERVDTESAVADSTKKSGKESKPQMVKFYPEGGDLVAGLTSRVAFTVVDDEGKHLKTKGALLNSQKQKICDVETDETGRGVFEVTSDVNPKYLQIADSKGKSKEFKLPDAKSDGCVLNLNMMDDDDITATITSSPSFQGRLLGYTIIHNGNLVECDTMSARAKITKRFSKYSIPQGVSQITFFDSNGQIQAERLFFICPYVNEDDSILVTTTQTRLTPCGKVNIDILAQPNSSVSFSAMDAATMTNGKVGNAKTWMLLSSEVAGYIDDPDYYFEADDVEHRKAADMLMMVQGWRRYDFQLMSGSKTLDKVEPVEDGLYFFGKLTHRSKRKGVENVDLNAYLYNRNGESFKGSAKTDSLGRYSFKLPDLYNDWALQIKSLKEGEAENYVIGIDRHFSPATRTLSPYEIETLPVGKASFFKEKDNEQEEEWVSITKKVHVLPTVKVKARKILGDTRVTWFDETEAQRKATVYYDCDEYSDKISDLGELMPGFDEWLISKNSLIDGNPDPPVTDAIYIVPDSVGKPLNNETELISIYDTKGEKPIVCYKTGLSYDNRPIVWIVNNTFCTITCFPESFRQFKFTRSNNDTGVIQCPDFLNEAKSVFFTEDTSILPKYIISEDIYALQPVIAMVYTHPLFYFKEKGLRKTHFYGYNKPTKFVMEDYSIVPPMEDFRRTIYWEPDLKTDSKGKASVEFYNNSSATQFFISAEGVTPEGKFIVSE